MRYIEEIPNEKFDSKIFKPGGFLGDRSADKNFTLTLYLRVRLLQRNPANGKAEETIYDASNIPHKIQKWNQADWLLFLSEYVLQANRCWDTAFLLKTPDWYDGFDFPESGAEKKKRNVRCRFLLSLTDNPHDAHVIIPVLRTVERGFRVHSMLYSFHDIFPEYYTRYHFDNSYSAPVENSYVMWQSSTIMHEVGHLLGLGHPNETSQECVLHPNSIGCYIGKFEYYLEAMGVGNQLTLKYAEPWQKRISAHTQTQNYREWKADWLSDEAAFRGTENLNMVLINQK